MLRASTLALLSAFAFAAFATASRAEDAPADGDKPAHKEGREGRGHDRANPLLKGITLTDDQKASLKKIQEDERKQHEAAKEANKDATPEQRKEDRKAAMKKHAEAVRAILTPDQAKTFDENLKELQEKHAKHEKKND